MCSNVNDETVSNDFLWGSKKQHERTIKTHGNFVFRIVEILAEYQKDSGALKYCGTYSHLTYLIISLEKSA